MNRPSVHELECFVAAAEALSFSKAAGKLNLSQPALSRQIQGLESKLTTRLLERNTRAVSLTHAGRLYLDDAKQVLTHLDRAGEVMRRVGAGEPQILRLAFVGALLDDGLVRLLQKFRADHPDCQIQMVDMAPAEQLTALERGEIDGAFIGAVPAKVSRQIVTLVWKREPLQVVLPEQHPLVKVESLKLSQFKADSWVMVSAKAAPGFREHVSLLCRKERFQPRVVQESDRVAAVLTMVAAGQGISLLPASLSRWLNTGVVFKEVNETKTVLTHVFAFRRGAPGDELQEFTRMLGTQ
jgi:DNA-binding transcriptional LysR family regulator